MPGSSNSIFKLPPWIIIIFVIAVLATALCGVIAVISVVYKSRRYVTMF